MDILEKEGIVLKTNVEVGKDMTARSLLVEYDAVLCALGATWPRDLPIPGLAAFYTLYFSACFHCSDATAHDLLMYTVSLQEKMLIVICI